MIGLLMVSGFILYDTSNVLHHYDDEEYVAAALELAWDFWYLMLKLIQIFMDRD
jgi:FtsH-binding integral membrane protein